MCGIAGFSLSPNERPINAKRLAQELLLGIEHRGPDATGAAWFSPKKGIPTVQKRDVKATDFVGGLALARRAQSAILHTRNWTRGKPENSLNNHPIWVGGSTEVRPGLIGVHNGMVDNDHDLFRALPDVRRQAEVDSEAIFAHLLYSGKPLHEALEDIDGTAAIAWFDPTRPLDLWLARCNSSPLHIKQTMAGSLVFGSTEFAVDGAMRLVGLKPVYTEDVVEGRVYRVRNGAICDVDKFRPGRMRYSSYYSRTMGYSSTSTSTSSTTTSSDPLFRSWSSDISTDFFDPKRDVYMDEEKYKRLYKHREDSVDKWYDRVANETEPYDHQLAAFAKCRPGDWAETDLAGEPVLGQVLYLPRWHLRSDTTLSPASKVTLRVYLPADDDSEVECVYVQRKWSQLTFLNKDQGTEGVNDLLPEPITDEADDMASVIDSLVDMQTRELAPVIPMLPGMGEAAGESSQPQDGRCTAVHEEVNADA